MGKEGDPGVIFHPFHLFRPARKSESQIPSISRPVRGRRWPRARSGFSNPGFGFTPAPAPTLSLDPRGSLSRPRSAPRAARVISRALGGRAGEGGLGRPDLRGQRAARAAGQSPAPAAAAPGLSPPPARGPRTPSPSRCSGATSGGVTRVPRARGAYPVRSAGRTRSFSAPRPSFCGGAGARTPAAPWPTCPASPPWKAAAGRAAGEGDRRTLTFP